ncbi:hypothetical protein CCACVL1_02493, partial [Corchorus capsularis]
MGERERDRPFILFHLLQFPLLRRYYRLRRDNAILFHKLNK